MTDPFQQDAQRRAALADKAMRIRLALYEAREARSGEAALAALDALYAFVDEHDGQLLYLGEDPEHSVAFAVPATCRQMTAQFGGYCKVCSDRISVGSVVYWDTSDRKLICTRCSMADLMGASK